MRSSRRLRFGFAAAAAACRGGSGHGFGGDGCFGGREGYDLGITLGGLHTRVHDCSSLIRAVSPRRLSLTLREEGLELSAFFVAEPRKALFEDLEADVTSGLDDLSTLVGYRRDLGAAVGGIGDAADQGTLLEPVENAAHRHRVDVDRGSESLLRAIRSERDLREDAELGQRDAVDAHFFLEAPLQHLGDFVEEVAPRVLHIEWGHRFHKRTYNKPTYEVNGLATWEICILRMVSETLTGPDVAASCGDPGEAIASCG